MTKTIKPVPSKSILRKRTGAMRKLFQLKTRPISEPDLQPSIGLRKYSRRGSQTTLMLLRGACGYSDSIVNDVEASSATCETETTQGTDGTSNFDWNDSSCETTEKISMNWSNANKVVAHSALLRKINPKSANGSAPLEVPVSPRASKSSSSSSESGLAVEFKKACISLKRKAPALDKYGEKAAPEYSW